MGWTGIFNWDSSESNKDILNRQFFSSAEQKYEPLKWSPKGNHTWLLYRHKETGRTYAAVILTERYRKEHEFRYKEIGLESGPCELDMPKAWLSELSEEYLSSGYCKDWFERYKAFQNKPKPMKVNLEDVYECTCKFDMRWASKYSIPANTPFFIKYTNWAGHKYFLLVQKDGERYRTTNCKITRKTFNSIQKKFVLNTKEEINGISMEKMD